MNGVPQRRDGKPRGSAQPAAGSSLTRVRTMSSEPRLQPELDEHLLRLFLAGDPAAHRTVEGWAREIVRFRPYGIPRTEHADIVQQAIGMLWVACSRPGFTLRHG